MKKILKQSFSLILALLMVLSMVPAMSLVADAAVAYGITKLQVGSSYKMMNLDFETKDHDYVYYGTEAYDWAVTTNSTHTKNVGVKVDIKLEAGGQTKTHSVTKTIAAGQRTVLVDYSTIAPVLPTTYFGDIRMTVDLWVDEQTQVAQLIVVFGRKAEVSSAGQSRWNYLRTSSATDGTGTFEYLNGAINFADNSWTVTLNPTKPVDLSNATVDAQIVDANGNVIDSVVGKAVTGNPALSLGNFPVAKSKMGTYAVKATFKAGNTTVAQLTAIYKLAPATPGTVDTEYKNSGDQLSHQFVTRDPDMVYGAGQDYDWHVTVGPLQNGANLKIQASIQDENGNVIGTIGPKDVEVPAATKVTDPATTLLSADEFANLTSDLTGTFTLFYQIANADGTRLYVTTTATFARTAEPGAYPGKVQGLIAPGYEQSITPKFDYADEDLVYIGAQPYDWKLTLGSAIDWTTIDVIANIKNAAGEIIMDCNKTVERTAATVTMLTPEDFDGLTTDLYGNFTLFCELQMEGTPYVRMQVTFSRIEGATPVDTTAPEFTYTSWEGCGIPPVFGIVNNSQFAKEVTLKLTLTQPNGNTIRIPKTGTTTFTLDGKHTTYLTKASEMNGAFNTQNGSYTLLVEGYWNVDDEAHKINTTVTYVKNDHPEKVLQPAKPATCTEAGWEAHYYCSGCNGTPGGKKEIPIDPNAHTFVDGVCTGCGAADLKFYRAKETNPYGNFKLTGEIIAYLTARKQATYDDYYVVFTYTYLDNVVTFKAAPSSSSDANYALFDCPVPAALMTTGIEATVYGVKGDKEYRGETIVFTARECVDAKLDMWINNYDKNAQVAKLFDTLVNMLAYGAQAQTRFGINVDNLATDGLPENYAAKIKTDVLTLKTHSNPSESGQKATLYSMSLMLKEKINMYGNFKVKSGFTKIEDYKVVIVHTKADGSTVTHEITDVELKTGNYVYFECDKVAPAQMRDELQITLYQNGEAVSATYIRSGETIVASLAAALQPLGNAAMQLADCAKAAFG